MEIQILEIGSRLNLDDLEEIAGNFRRTKGEIKPPLRLGKKVSTGDPAMGWISNLKVAGGKLWATVSDLPGKIRTAVGTKQYKSIIAEVMSDYRLHGLNIGKVLSSVALLGTGLKTKSLESLANYIAVNEVGSFSKVLCFEQQGPGIAERIEAAGNLLEKETKKTKILLTEQNSLIKESIELNLNQGVRTMPELKTFTNKTEAEDDLYRRAEKLAFKTDKSFDECYKHLLTDSSDPAVIKLTDNRETVLTDMEAAGEQLDRAAQRYMLHNDVSYTKALSFAMEENPNLAKIYTGLDR
ncbi:MAG: hypothetical protein PF690_05430 [Deltaproteobacteria bacterium]|jgi:hypothetical protein|nr:hypothetical protein [Deltaproteobacteria bacterium]